MKLFRRELKGGIFASLCLVATLFGILSLSALLVFVFWDASGWLSIKFLTKPPSRFPEEAGIYPALLGSIFTISLVGIFSLVLGVGAAIYLEEYLSGGRLKRFIEMNILNLAGVPSIVYGLLGLGIFVTLLGMAHGTVLVGSLTLTLLILPIVIVSSQEAIRAVPDSLRQASYGLGATKWQTISRVVLPQALPGVMTGMILALGRAIGETAPLIMIGAAATIFSPPSSLFSPFSALPIQIFLWADLPQEGFRHGVVPAAIVMLLVILLSLNSFAIFIRYKYQIKKL